MKLTSKNICNLIVQNVLNNPYLYIDDDEMEIVLNPKSWKRTMKTKMSKAVVAYNAGSIEDFMEMGPEGITILNKQAPTEKSVVRNFVIPDLTLDCTVVTDELDTTVIAMLWHQD